MPLDVSLTYVACLSGFVCLSASVPAVSHRKDRDGERHHIRGGPIIAGGPVMRSSLESEMVHTRVMLMYLAPGFEGGEAYPDSEKATTCKSFPG